MDRADFLSVCGLAHERLGADAVGAHGAHGADRADQADQADRADPAAYLPGAFICEAEAWLFSQLAARWSGRGRIVDAGSFLGASTRALISGLPTSARERASGASSKPIVALDRFVVGDAYVQKALARLGQARGRGESFLDLFLDAIGADLRLVEVRAGDVTRVGRIDEPIELCVIDLAKSQALNAHLLSSWFARLVPGVSVVVQQDFFSPFHPWIAASMAPLLPCFDLAPWRIGESAVFRLARPLSSEQIAAAAQRDPADALGWEETARWSEAFGADDMKLLRLGRCVAMSAATEAGRRARAIREWEVLGSETPPAACPKWPRLMRLAGRALGIETPPVSSPASEQAHPRVAVHGATS